MHQLWQALVYRRFDSYGQSTSAGSEFDRKKRISTCEAQLHNRTAHHHPNGLL